MAKSTRSKWKKMHRRERAKAERGSTTKRIQQLHHKLELTVRGGISAVPPQEPETRFHFLNPVLDPRVPNTRRHLNNNYTAELNEVTYDYSKPLRLAPPRTNLHGKSDPAAPHPTTLDFETVDADAPLAGRAMTKADVERQLRQQTAAAATVDAASLSSTTTTACGNEEGEDEDGPEEYVLNLEENAPRRVTSSAAKKSKKTSSSVSSHSTGKAKGAGTAATTAAVAKRVAAMANIAAEGEAETSSVATQRIPSMQDIRKKNSVITSASGSSKMKKVGTSGKSAARVMHNGNEGVKRNIKATKR